MIPWKTYAGRRNINLAFVIDSNPELSDYNEVFEHYKARGVEPPSIEEYESALKRTRKYMSPESQITKDVSKSRTKSTSKKTDENPNELWEDAQDGAYQTKKTTTKKKAPARKTTTRKTTTRKKS